MDNFLAKNYIPYVHKCTFKQTEEFIS